MPEKMTDIDNPLIKEITTRFKKVESAYGAWQDVAKEDYRFALGDQWTDEDRKTLQDQGRPCLTFNRIRPIINIVSGYQRDNSTRIKVNPEGGEDRIFSEVMDRAIKAIDKWSHFSFKQSYWFDDDLYCGKGFLEGFLTYDKDPILGEIGFKQLSPYQVYPDPEFKEYDLNEGCPYVFKTTKLTKDELKELYPGHDTLIDGFVKDVDDTGLNGSGVVAQEGSNDDYGNKPNPTMVINKTDDDSEASEDPKFTVKEYWRIKKVKKFFVINKEDGLPERFDTIEEANDFVTLQGSGKVIDRKVPEMWVAAVVAGFLLQDEKSPFEPHYSGYPFFRALADWVPNAETEILRVQGLTRSLKDPQKEKNKAKSQNLHILNTQANSGWIGDDDALTPAGWDELEHGGAKAGLVVKKKIGRELREIFPKGPNAGMIQRENAADEEFKQISTVNPDLMGMQEGTASGKAIGLRIKQAVLALARLFFNFRYSQEIVGNFMLQMIPLVFDSKKLIRVLGPSYMAKALDPEKYPEGLKEGHIEAFLILVKDNKYDVSVADSGHNSTIRYEIFTELSELLKAGAPLPIELIIDYLDLPNSEEVKQKIKESQQMAAQAAAAKGAPGA
ncbi:hypothetical protein KKH13_04525 [Patescibacteria group bacterium]|uniref:Putative structural protein n=1 Tax=viral metagenome TaxID=1070528 RepID=A0A6M3KJF4_9ZZZZ|nr:hypothetical protein [Patescibacteria group bacterium]